MEAVILPNCTPSEGLSIWKLPPQGGGRVGGGGRGVLLRNPKKKIFCNRKKKNLVWNFLAEKSKIPQPMDSWGAREERKVVVYVIYNTLYS